MTNYIIGSWFCNYFGIILDSSGIHGFFYWQLSIIIFFQCSLFLIVEIVSLYKEFVLLLW